jgi:hypothetical protein
MAGDGVESENQVAEIEDSGGASAGLVLRTGSAILKADVKPPPARVKLRLTERDYDIFGFLLEQKFSSLDALYFRFFDQRKDPADPLPHQLFVARQRLGMLRRAGLIMTERVYSDPKNLYLLTPLGFHAFKMRRDQDAYSSPVSSVDFRNFEHDTAVNYCRVAIEKMGKSMRWFSERRLRMQGFDVSGVRATLPDTIVPDGIFISSKGERIAFELEYTQRKKSRYQWKIAQYETVMSGSKPLIHRVLFVGGNERVYRDLKDVLQGHPDFWLESYAHFLGRLFPASDVAQVHRQLTKITDGGVR